MHVALMIPCYIDQLKPTVGLSTLELLEAIGISATFPQDQTCCGQPFLTAGEVAHARDLAERTIALFDEFDAIVTPSGSCAATMRHRFPELVSADRAESLAERTWELCEFLVANGGAEKLAGRFPHRVGLHASCHALRELGHGRPSESRGPERPDPARILLSALDGIELIDLLRPDECCGFGGVFSIEEEAVACRMGRDRVRDHCNSGAEIVASVDSSCLLHMEGVARRRTAPLRMLHVAEILAEALRESGSAQASKAAETTDESR